MDFQALLGMILNTHQCQVRAFHLSTQPHEILHPFQKQLQPPPGTPLYMGSHPLCQWGELHGTFYMALEHNMDNYFQLQHRGLKGPNSSAS